MRRSQKVHRLKREIQSGQGNNISISCVGRPFQEELLQRVLEIVDSFVRILQEVILEDCLGHVSVSRETALEEWSSLGYLDNDKDHPIIYKFFISIPTNSSVVR